MIQRGLSTLPKKQAINQAIVFVKFYGKSLSVKGADEYD